VREVFKLPIKASNTNFQIAIMKKKSIMLRVIAGVCLFLANLGLAGAGLERNAYGQSPEQYYTLNEFGGSLQHEAAIMKSPGPFAGSVMQQEVISGTVTDAQSGETLPGVNILVKGTTTGA